jgi:carboxyl-terminal processing protease
VRSLVPPASARAAFRVAGVLGLMVLAYVGGVLTGVVGSRDDRRPVARHTVLDEAADRIAARAARPVDRAALDRAAVEGMLRAVGDRWSTYYGAAEFRSFHDALEGQYAGVGLWLRSGAGGTVQVGSVQPASAAARADLRAGDQLVSVGGTSVSGAGMARIAALLRGPAHSAVTVTVRRGSTARTLRMTRSQVSSHDVVVEHLAGDVLRVQVRAFARGVGREVRAAMGSGGVHHAGGVVLDLRDDPGGLLDEAVEVCSVFLDGGPVVSYERRGRSPRTLDAATGGDLTTPLVVLVNSSTASAAEVVTGALQDRNRAVVVGSRTFGKGSVQEPSRLSDGSALELTVGRYLTTAGRSLDGVGVEPDVTVSATAPNQEAERRAIEVLTGLVAALGGTGRG